MCELCVVTRHAVGARVVAGFVRGPLATQQGSGRRGRNIWGGCDAHRRLLKSAMFAAGERPRRPALLVENQMQDPAARAEPPASRESTAGPSPAVPPKAETAR